MLYEMRSVGGISYLYALRSSDKDADDHKQQKKKYSTFYYIVIIRRLLN